MDMEVVTLTVVCKKGDGENIANEMLDSHISQLGIYSQGANIREAKKWEENEVIEQTPAEVLDKYR